MSEQHDNLEVMRHSMAHIMAAAMQKLWPQAKFGVGPVVEDGFYYDVDLSQTLSLDDLKKIETEMSKIVAQDVAFEKIELPIGEAIKKFEAGGQTYKVDLLKDLKERGTTNMKDLSGEELGVSDNADKITTVTLYRTGEFEDLCRGPHVDSTGQVGAFKLTRVSGAYWRGNQSNPQMQRVYGVGFATKKELDEYFVRLAEAEKNDHRVLGPQMGIYMLSDAVGAGLPLWMPNGELVYHQLLEYMREKELARGYKYVATPILGHEDLYKRSGHAKFYDDDMYSFKDDEGNKFYLKPMNCPHHHMIYEKLVQSYRDLPLKLAEPGHIYRRELSGVLSGLIRARSFTQNDSHIYVTDDQLKAEFLDVLALFKEVYDEVGIADYWYRLSLPDFEKDKYEGDKKQWEHAAEVIRQALKESKSDFVEAEGEAAFYGPKLDVQIRNVLGKEDTIATIQVDVLVPTRMGLKYVDSSNEEKAPIIIHRAILGSYERFIAFLIEKTGGHFPLWLAPEQVRIATLNDSKKVVDYATKLAGDLKAAGLRVSVDDSSESVGKKVRASEVAKVNYTLVIGEREVDSDELAVRGRGQGGSSKFKVADFISKLQEEVTARSQKPLIE